VYILSDVCRPSERLLFTFASNLLPGLACNYLLFFDIGPATNQDGSIEAGEILTAVIFWGSHHTWPGKVGHPETQVAFISEVTNFMRIPISCEYH